MNEDGDAGVRGEIERLFSARVGGHYNDGTGGGRAGADIVGGEAVGCGGEVGVVH